MLLSNNTGYTVSTKRAQQGAQSRDLSVKTQQHVQKLRFN